MEPETNDNAETDLPKPSKRRPRGIAGRETEESLAAWKLLMEEKKVARETDLTKRSSVQNRITRNRRLRISEPEAEK
jgi:hypothetical protein